MAVSETPTIGHLGDNREPHQSPQVVGGPEIIHIIEDNREFLLVLVVSNRKDVKGLSHLGRNLLDHLGGDLQPVDADVIRSLRAAKAI